VDAGCAAPGTFFEIYPEWGMRRRRPWRIRLSGTWSHSTLADNNRNRTDTESDNAREPEPVDFFDPWDRQLSFERRSRLLSPVQRDEHRKAN